MPRALETLDHVMQQLERGQLSAIEAVEALLAEEITVRESRRAKAALQAARLATIKTLSGFDFSFQPSLDRNRILALAQLDRAGPIRESPSRPAWRQAATLDGGKLGSRQLERGKVDPGFRAIPAYK
jgi:hypothetical protein